ncbi:imm11 family protein [Chryseobacterium zhengzhouense]|uniref:Imm11 family protein n=1 Tax=Chryseobacterium zhengzhouense TaxID=1636086 RepID=A0ABW2M0W7_9FLAO
MKIYRIRPYSGDNNVYIESTGFNKTIVFENLDGEKINEIKTFNFTLKNKTKNYPDLLGTGSSEFFVSNELKTFLEKNITKQKINFIEFTIGKKQYWFLNIIGLRDCMDYKNSIYSKYENNQPDEITNLVIDEKKIDQNDIFRLKDNSIPIFITDSIKIKLEEMNFTGIKIIESMDLTVG